MNDPLLNFALVSALLSRLPKAIAERAEVIAQAHGFETLILALLATEHARVALAAAMFEACNAVTRDPEGIKALKENLLKSVTPGLAGLQVSYSPFLPKGPHGRKH